jgi:hypothetical protein
MVMGQGNMCRNWRLFVGSGLLLGGSVMAASAYGQKTCGCVQQLPPPPGTFVNQWFRTQYEKAQADRFTIYRCEWYQDGNLLGPSGATHLKQIAQSVGGAPFPVVIQPSYDAVQNELRRQLVVHCLAQAGVADADHRVILDFPQAEGLLGEETYRVYGQFLRGASSGTSYGGGGGGGVGSFGGNFSGGSLGGGAIGGLGGGGSMFRGY